MQALHMTETDGVGLEFRGQFTTRCSILKMAKLIALLREEGEEPLVCLKEEEALTKLATFLAKFNDLVSDIILIIISRL